MMDTCSESEKPTETDLPKYVNYWMTSSSKHDCFFNVGPESGPQERIGAIRIFLTGHSEVFRRMLEESPLAEKGDISVNDSDPDTFRNFLKCIYGGAENVIEKLTFEECLNILYLCEKYMTLELRENISCYVLKKYQPLSTENVLKSLLIPACLESRNMAKAISVAIQNDTGKILYNKLFFDLDSVAVEFIMKQNKITTKEVELWEAVLNWAKKKTNSQDPKELRLYLRNIIKHIRFCAMESNDFCSSVVISDVLTEEEVFAICKSIGTNTLNPKLSDRICHEITSRTKISCYRRITKIINNIAKSSSPTNLFQVELGSYKFNLTITKTVVVSKSTVVGFSKFDLILCCDRTKVNNTLPWSCLVSLKISVGACGYCNRNLSKSFSAEISSSNRFQNLGFLSLQELKGFIKSDSLELVCDFQVDLTE